jgi:DNA-binding MarR family transcriptional regulator
MNTPKYESSEVQNLFKLIQTMNAVEKSFSQAFESYGLTLIQYWVLTNIHQKLPHSIRINQLAKLMNSSHQNIKQICVSLENKGWLKLNTDPMDKRSTMVLLSDQFLRQRFELDLIFEQGLKQLYVRISKEDFYRIGILLEKLNDNLKTL